MKMKRNAGTSAAGDLRAEPRALPFKQFAWWITHPDLTPNHFSMMSIDEFGGNPLRSLPPTSSIRQKKIEQNGKKQHKKTAIALVDLASTT